MVRGPQTHELPAVGDAAERRIGQAGHRDGRRGQIGVPADDETVVDRARWLASHREKEGYMSQYVAEEKEGGPQILECHSPIMNLLDQYPIIARLEKDMFEGVLGTEVRREETRTSGLYECAFYFAI